MNENWNDWRVALHMGNDEFLYPYMCALIARQGRDRAAATLAHELGGRVTPDGVRFTPEAIGAAVRGFAPF